MPFPWFSILLKSDTAGFFYEWNYEMQLDLTTFHAVDLSTIAGGLKTGANFSCQHCMWLPDHYSFISISNNMYGNSFSYM